MTTESSSLLKELESNQQEIEKLVHSLVAESSTGRLDQRSPAALQLKFLVQASYRLISTGLALHGHTTLSARLTEDWSQLPLEVISFEGGRYAPWQLLRPNLLLLQEIIAQQRRQQLEGEEGRKDARTAATRTARMAYLTVAISVFTVVVGNIDKWAKLVQPNPAPILLEGPVTGLPAAHNVAKEAADELQVACSPKLDGVVPALGPDTWSILALSTAPAKAVLTCSLQGEHWSSDPVVVRLPSTEELPALKAQRIPSAPKDIRPP